MLPTSLVPLTERHLEPVKLFLDRWSGVNFLTDNDLRRIISLSMQSEKNCSFTAWYGQDLVGVRLTYAPGKLITEVKGLTSHKWKVDPRTVGYFKSLFVSENYRDKGIGKDLSLSSLKVLKDMGAEAVLCHCWLESPENSSMRYLEAMGFESIQTHPNFWFAVDYQCVRCAPLKCVCTSVEMIKYL